MRCAKCGLSTLYCVGFLNKRGVYWCSQCGAICKEDINDPKHYEVTYIWQVIRGLKQVLA